MENEDTDSCDEFDDLCSEECDLDFIDEDSTTFMVDWSAVQRTVNIVTKRQIDAKSARGAGLEAAKQQQLLGF